MSEWRACVEEGEGSGETAGRGRKPMASLYRIRIEEETIRGRSGG